MKRLLVEIAIISMFGSLVVSNSTFCQLLPPNKRAAHVVIMQGPKLELANDYLVVIEWTTNNPGGDDEHFAIIHYGTNPNNLSQTAKSPFRLNRTHPDTTFRVRILGLKPQTTYYYWVTSAGADGISDGVRSPVNHFTTPPPGKRIVAGS
jgi:Purple acid Phosphatase, N-terminal domain